jgi:hypothetical protein
LVLYDLDGIAHDLAEPPGGRVRAFVFLSTGCPIARSYTPTLNKLAESLRQGAKAELFGVVSDRGVSRAEAQRHFTEFAASFPVLFDGSGLLSKELSPDVVPEAFVFDSSGAIAYRGAIDDAWGAIGRRRPQVRHHYLADAIDAVLGGDAPDPAQTPAVGCVVTDGDSIGQKTKGPTYHRDVAPIVQARCEGCHRTGQVAPFTLSSIDDAREHAAMIRVVTHGRLMPPWGPESSASPLVGDRRLSDAELAILRQWIDEGCIAGDPADGPGPIRYAEGWRLGEPDLVVEMPESFAIPADGPDLLQNFVLPIELDGDRLVSAVEFRPGNPRVVHHAVFFLDQSGAARRLDAAAAGPGYANFGGPGFFPSGALGGWSVGNTPRPLPGGRGRYLKKGADLVVQVHYHPSGKPETDRSTLGIHFVDKPLSESLRTPGTLVGSIWASNYEIDIPAGEASYRRTASYTLPRDVTLIGVVPHMHLLGKNVDVVAQSPSGESVDLLTIPRWDFNWQDEYYYERPIELRAGTELVVTAEFDNSADNPQQPRDPPQRVTWGEGTEDEMMYCFFLLTAERVEDLVGVVLDNLAHDGRQPRLPHAGP